VIPGVSSELLHRIGLYADRLSTNIEVPSEKSLCRLAPQKKPTSIFAPMKQITQTQAEQKTLKFAGFINRKPYSFGSGLKNIEAGDGDINDITNSGNGDINDITSNKYDIPKSDNPVSLREGRLNYREKFAPAGQTTQMIIGASPESDYQIMKTSEALYHRFSMKRVYFSAYVAVADSAILPPPGSPAPLLREHRLYQADWLLRFYGFNAGEILSKDEPMLDYDLDPKIVWAIRNLELFPVEINKAPLEELIRIPGIGGISAKRIVRQRKIAGVTYDDLKKMGVVLKRARFFITCSGKYYGDRILEPYYIRDNFTGLDPAAIRLKLSGGSEKQISFFDTFSERPKTRQPLSASMFDSVSNDTVNRIDIPEINTTDIYSTEIDVMETNSLWKAEELP